jgi:hypothetical protein
VVCCIEGRIFLTKARISNCKIGQFALPVKAAETPDGGYGQPALWEQAERPICFKIYKLDLCSDMSILDPKPATVLGGVRNALEEELLAGGG